MDGDVKVPLDEFVRQVAREAAWTVIEEHVKQCSIREVERRVRRIEVALVAALVLAGIGNAFGPSLVRMIGGG